VSEPASKRNLRPWLPVACALALSLAAVLPGLPGSPGRVAAATLPAGFQDQVVLSGLNQPTAIAFSPDGRIFVAEKRGIIKVFQSIADTNPTVFADFRTEVYNYWDRGLLGMALDPGFPATPYIYVLYTRDALPGGTAPHWGQADVDGDPCPTPPGPTSDGCVASGRLARLTANGNVMSTFTPLLDGWCQQYPSHSMGQIVFGPDGQLYASAGDGASFDWADYGQGGGSLPNTPTLANPCGDPPTPPGTSLTPPTAEGGSLRAQDLQTMGDPVGLNGSVIRVNPATGAASAGNPLAGSADLNARRILAYGGRNPFRFAFRPGTSELWIGDVGWSTWEEIDRIASPTASVHNMGWPCYEGPDQQPSFANAGLNICTNLYAQGPSAVLAPYYAYNHADQVVPGETCPSGGSSITGLAFYQGGGYPAAYGGTLFFADYTRNCIWAMAAGTNGLPDPSSITTFDAGAASPIDLEIGPGGDVFYVDFTGGTIHRIRYFPSNQPPTARISASPTSGPTPLTVQFDGTASSDPDAADPITYSWDLNGDGTFGDSTSATTSYTYNAVGTVNVQLRVTDSAGASDTATIPITAGNTAPVPVIDTPAASFTWKVGDPIAISGHATDAEDGTVPASGLHWDVYLHHCPSTCHIHDVTSFDGASFSMNAPDHEYPSYLELKLTATDSGGLSASVSRDLDPQTVKLTIASAPAGLTLSIGSLTGAAPLQRTVIIGSANTVSAPNQTVNGVTYTYSHWSDGLAQTHTITAPPAPTTYTATFTYPNLPPSFATAPRDSVAYEGQPLSIQVSATDADGDALQYAATGLPAGTSINATTGLISGTPGSTTAGGHHVSLTITDGRGGTLSGAFELSVMDAIFPARTVSFSAGTYVGYHFSSSGAVTGSKSASLGGASSASADRRRLWGGRPYLRITNGIWAGYWVEESSSVRLPGTTALVTFGSARSASFAAGTTIGYQFSANGTVTASKSWTLAHASSALSDSRAVINGRPYVHITNGVWAGFWIAEGEMVISSGSHRGYQFSLTGATLSSKSAWTASAAISSRTWLLHYGVRYWSIPSGVFAGYWMPESSTFRPRVWVAQ
jgi:glucose/arabinose dehydrogenase